MTVDEKNCYKLNCDLPHMFISDNECFCDLGWTAEEISPGKFICKKEECTNKEIWKENEGCVKLTCPYGYHIEKGSCIKLYCDKGWKMVEGSHCEKWSCPPGYEYDNGECISICDEDRGEH